MTKPVILNTQISGKAQSGKRSAISTRSCLKPAKPLMWGRFFVLARLTDGCSWGWAGSGWFGDVGGFTASVMLLVKDSTVSVGGRPRDFFCMCTCSSTSIKITAQKIIAAKAISWVRPQATMRMVKKRRPARKMRMEPGAP